MSNITQKATVTTVKLGCLEFEGLLLENGQFAIAQQQVAALFSVIPTSAPKWVKSLLGEGFQLFSVKTDRNQGRRQNRSESALSLADFERVIVELTIKGNETAANITRALVGLSLTQLFSDAFGVKFEAQDRQNYLTARLAGKVTRRTLTDAIKAYLDTNEVSDNYRKFIYSNCSDKINRALFGKSAAKLCVERGCDKDELRNSHSEAELILIDRIEGHAVKLIDRGMEPMTATQDALDFYQ